MMKTEELEVFDGSDDTKDLKSPSFDKIPNPDLNRAKPPNHPPSSVEFTNNTYTNNNNDSVAGD